MRVEEEDDRDSCNQRDISTPGNYHLDYPADRRGRKGRHLKYVDLAIATSEILLDQCGSCWLVYAGFPSGSVWRVFFEVRDEFENWSQPDTHTPAGIPPEVTYADKLHWPPTDPATPNADFTWHRWVMRQDCFRGPEQSSVILLFLFVRFSLQMKLPKS